MAERTMRAKMTMTEVKLTEHSDNIVMVPVCRSTPYPADGSDEDNTYAKFSPCGRLELTIANPALLGLFRPGQKFYVDFTPVPDDKK